MKPKSEKFSVCMMFGARGECILEIADRLIYWLKAEIGIEKLYQKGLINLGNLNVKTLRQREAKGFPSSHEWHKKIKSADEAGIYIYDSAYTKDLAPQILINLHVTQTGKISEIPVRQKNGPVGCFILIAINQEVRGLDLGDFRRITSEIFEKISGIKAKIWDELPYLYDGLTSIEWAYRNVSASLGDGMVENWEQNADLVLTPQRIKGDQRSQPA